MLKGFRDFILRGNVVDLAVAVVIGTAVYNLVASFTASFVDPLLAAAGGAHVADGLGFRVLGDNPSTFIDVGKFITAIITFLITAAVLYFIIVVPMTKLKEMRARGQEPEPEVVGEDVLVLREIRDLLAGRGTPPSDTSEETPATAGSNSTQR